MDTYGPRLLRYPALGARRFDILSQALLYGGVGIWGLACALAAWAGLPVLWIPAGLWSGGSAACILILARRHVRRVRAFLERIDYRACWHCGRELPPGTAVYCETCGERAPCGAELTAAGASHAAMEGCTFRGAFACCRTASYGASVPILRRPCRR